MAQVMWMDTETTGLDPNENGIIEIAAIFAFPNTDKKSKRFEALVNPRKGRGGKEYEVVFEPKALEVNGITEEEILSRGDIDSELMKLDSQVEPWCQIAGWNCAGFDIPMLKAAYARAGIKWRFHWHCLDMMVVANWLKHCEVINPRSLALGKMAKYLGIDPAEFGEAHRAMPDVWTTLAISKRLREDFIGGRTTKF